MVKLPEIKIRPRIKPWNRRFWKLLGVAIFLTGIGALLVRQGVFDWLFRPAVQEVVKATNLESPEPFYGSVEAETEALGSMSLIEPADIRIGESEPDVITDPLLKEGRRRLEKILKEMKAQAMPLGVDINFMDIYGHFRDETAPLTNAAFHDLARRMDMPVADPLEFTTDEEHTAELEGKRYAFRCTENTGEWRYFDALPAEKGDWLDCWEFNASLSKTGESGPSSVEDFFKAHKITDTPEARAYFKAHAYRRPTDTKKGGGWIALSWRAHEQVWAVFGLEDMVTLFQYHLDEEYKKEDETADRLRSSHFILKAQRGPEEKKLDGLKEGIIKAYLTRILREGALYRQERMRKELAAAKASPKEKG